jgi:hypothetical protein
VKVRELSRYLLVKGGQGKKFHKYVCYGTSAILFAGYYNYQKKKSLYKGTAKKDRLMLYLHGYLRLTL